MIKTANRKGLPLHLTEQERETLLHQTKATRRTVADRARLLLALDTGQNSLALAKQTGLHPVTIRHLKRAFSETDYPLWKRVNGQDADPTNAKPSRRLWSNRASAACSRVPTRGF